MEEKMVKNLEEKTGKSIAEWIAIAKASGETKHMAIIKYLKTEHALTHGYANLIVHYAKQSHAGASEDDDLITSQYSGKESLKPIFDQLMMEIKAFGDDLEIAPKKAYVSLRRKKQFALIQPSTKTRVDLGIKLQDVEPKGTLESAGKWNTMVSHRVRLSSTDDIRPEVIDWLKMAYDAAG